MKKTILWSLVFALFFSFSNVFADELWTQKCVNNSYPADLLNKDNFYFNQKFCNTNYEGIYSVDILDKNYKYLDIKDVTGKDEYYSITVIWEKDWKKHTKIFLNGKKIMDFLSDKQKHFSLELAPRWKISTYWNHYITLLWYYEGLSEVSDNDLLKTGVYIDWVKIFRNIWAAEYFLQDEYIGYLNWNEENIPKKYKNVKLSPADVTKYSKVITQFNERKYTKEQKEEIFNKFKEYFYKMEQKFSSKENISDREYKNFLIYNYIYSEIKIEYLKERGDRLKK